MLSLSKDNLSKLNHFRTPQGQAAIETLAQLLFDEAIRQCLFSEGNVLYREQGKAQLANWLLALPKGLQDAANAANVEPVGQSF